MGRWAHPRVGGENVSQFAARPWNTGSSPRGRGKPALGKARANRRRLIPAWAGKTRSEFHRSPALPAHPRVGGENPNQRSARPASRWLIPAWAGKTYGTPGRASSRAAHPRVGGENGFNVVVVVVHCGSSPRGRGKPGAVNWSYRSGRLIPAWAGKTQRLFLASLVRAAHPRVGGENSR